MWCSSSAPLQFSGCFLSLSFASIFFFHSKALHKSYFRQFFLFKENYVINRNQTHVGFIDIIVSSVLSLHSVMNSKM